MWFTGGSPYLIRPDARGTKRGRLCPKSWDAISTRPGSPRRCDSRIWDRTRLQSGIFSPLKTTPGTALQFHQRLSYGPRTSRRDRPERRSSAGIAGGQKWRVQAVRGSEWVAVRQGWREVGADRNLTTSSGNDGGRPALIGRTDSNDPRGVRTGDHPGKPEVAVRARGRWRRRASYTLGLFEIEH